MALLILAGLQMLPGDIYEAAKIDGVHPIKVFWRITLPLVRPALMVAIIFRGLDALRIFDLIYVLTPNNAQTTSMSVYARQNLFDFDKFSYGSAASTFLFLVILDHHHRLHQGRPPQFRGRPVMLKLIKWGLFYLLVAIIAVVAVFPFYYAILTSFKSGTAIFQVDYWPKDFSLTNYVKVFKEGHFARNLLNSLFIATSVVLISLLFGVTAAFALSRVQFRGRTLLLLTILSVSMFPQIAVLAGLFELIRWMGLYNTPFCADLLLHDLHAALHGVGAHHLHARAADRDRGGGDRRRRQPVEDHHQGLPAADVAGAGDHRAPRLHRRLERVPLRADLHLQRRAAHRAGRDRADLRARPNSRCRGATSWPPR